MRRRMREPAPSVASSGCIGTLEQPVAAQIANQRRARGEIGGLEAMLEMHAARRAGARRPRAAPG